MLPASNRGAGQNIGFPDVCNTIVGPATVPIPYPNIAMNAQGVGFSVVVKISGVNALNLGSQIPMTSGDEAGTAHPTIKGAGKWTTGSPIVMIDKMPAITLTCPSTGNNMNNAVGAQVVPSAVNVMMCRRGSGDLGQRSVECEHELGPGVRYVRLRHIGFGVAQEIAAAAATAKALVIDLCGNPGGALEAAVALAGSFLPPGALVARLHEGDGDITELSARGLHLTLPLVVLIDDTTASAAELVAACLQDHGRALLIGRRSYGKRTIARTDRAVHEQLRWEGPHPRASNRLVPDVPTSQRGDALHRHAFALAVGLLAR